MPRPPKNQQGPSASERMENAFWHMLEQKPFSKITVSDIVKESHINRNAFYYHHESIDDLARKAVQGLLAEEGPFMMAEIIKTNGTYLDEVLASPERSEMLKRVRLVAGPHGSPELTDMLKQALTSIWYSSFQVDEDELDAASHVVITFAIGGFMEVLGEWEIGEAGITPQTLVSSGMAETVARLVASALAPAAADQSKLEEMLSVQQ